MSVIGRVDSLWRYPVKSMRGEELQQAFLGFCGVYGDRYYAFLSSAALKGFPYLTAREQQQMLLYRPLYRNPETSAKPPNLEEAEALAPGVTPLYSSAAGLHLDVETPTGKTLEIDDPELIRALGEGLSERHELTLARSDRAMTDCRPISLFSVQTARQLSQELGMDVNKNRFRANIYIDLSSGHGFDEDRFVGSTLRIGEKAVIKIVDRDPRCKMITLDADTAQASPEIMKQVARSHEGKAGVYAAVLTEALIHPGDEITLLN